MNNQLMKLLMIRYTSVVVIFLVCRFLMTFFLDPEDKFAAIIPMILAIFLAPRLKKTQTETGNQYQLNILFTDRIIK